MATKKKGKTKSGKTDKSGEVAISREERAPTARGAHPLAHLRDEIDRLFDDAFRGFPLHRPGLGRSLFEGWPLGERFGAVFGASAPTVDFVEKDKEYEITAELPGMDEKDIELELSDSHLSIKGRKEEKKEEKRKDYHLSERRFGSFQRSLVLPDDGDADKIRARFDKGLLTVTLPKKGRGGKRGPRKVAVEGKRG